ncbi:cytoplasmic protein [Lottiidibacillus patelloidae]|uniref:Cytoplasmic protein n=1 Tax=Lottiidibacillus patelloidae TaxID=2670334 RepID=A0A263BTY9_9BACI|nr:DUF523 and DUF1722 domain-containing protein [Lottiidibacillus patelloidae]OZM57012.1 cytoplasmic protein [Lottiidibacillus patelloidae]
MTRNFVKPNVVVSKCLEFDECRYNGEVLPDATVRNLLPFVTFTPICPEVEIGLGTPREVIRIVREGEDDKLVQPSTNEDLTDKMVNFTKTYLESLNEEVDGFLLKGRSPSCGIRDVKIYGGMEKAPTVAKGSGLFARGVNDQYPNLAIEEEGRLKNFTIREHYFTKLFTLAEYRTLKNAEKISQLQQFHAKNKYLFMAYNQLRLKKLGRILANNEKGPYEEVYNNYKEELGMLFAKAPRYTSNINVCEHIFGYFSKQLTSNEKQYFLDLLEKYRERKIPLSSLTGVLKSWVIRFEDEYLLMQTYFEPYPEELIAISDSGKGRSYS